MGQKKVKMPGRTLKLHDEYLKRLELYARASKIDVEYKTEDSDGVYVPSRRKIRIDPDLNDSHQVSVLLHELGHSLDDRFSKKMYLKRIDKAYTALHLGTHTRSQLRLIREAERRAWHLGRIIAKMTKIRLGKWYEESRKACLESYK